MDKVTGWAKERIWWKTFRWIRIKEHCDASLKIDFNLIYWSSAVAVETVQSSRILSEYNLGQFFALCTPEKTEKIQQQFYTIHLPSKLFLSDTCLNWRSFWSKMKVKSLRSVNFAQTLISIKYRKFLTVEYAASIHIFTAEISGERSINPFFWQCSGRDLKEIWFFKA